MTEIRIALSMDSLLYFPFYLLKKDTVTYGLEGYKIYLESFDSDLKAYEALENGYHFAVCDPVSLLAQVRDDEKDKHNITIKGIIPLITKTSLWGLTNNDNHSILHNRNSEFLGNVNSDGDNTEFEKIYTHEKSTSAYHVLKYLVSEKSFPLNEVKNIKTNSKHSILRPLSSTHTNDNANFVVTSDILIATALDKDDSSTTNKLDFYDIGIEIFKKNIFTALLSHQSLINTNDLLIKKMISAIHAVLDEFRDTPNDKFTHMALRIIASKEKCIKEYDGCKEMTFNSNSVGFVPNEKDVKNALVILKEHNIYADKSVGHKKFWLFKDKKNRLRSYWVNACKPSTFGKEDQKERYVKSYFYYSELWEKKKKKAKYQDVADWLRKNYYVVIGGTAIVLIVNTYILLNEVENLFSPENTIEYKVDKILEKLLPTTLMDKNDTK